MNTQKAKHNVSVRPDSATNWMLRAKPFTIQTSIDAQEVVRIMRTIKSSTKHQYNFELDRRTHPPMVVLSLAERQKSVYVERAFIAASIHAVPNMHLTRIEGKACVNLSFSEIILQLGCAIPMLVVFMFGMMMSMGTAPVLMLYGPLLLILIGVPIFRLKQNATLRDRLLKTFEDEIHFAEAAWILEENHL
jgi:hypothetical protein